MAQLSRGRRLMGEINVVPYIDVMLVLLIIFMVTAPLLAQGVKVDLPKAAAEPLEQNQRDPLILSIDQNGLLYLNVGGKQDQALDAETAGARATAAMRRDPERAVLVKGDERVAYGRVVEAMVLLQQAGATKVGFMTSSPVTEKKKR
jgi:biopolymer transport protein TolR